MDRKCGTNRRLARLLCVLALAAALGAVAMPALAEGLKVGTEIRVMLLGSFEITARTEDFTLPEGGSQQLKASASQAVDHWLWECSTDGGKTWHTVGTQETFTITNAAPNRDADGVDIPYQYRVTATNSVGESASAVIQVLVSDAYAYRTVTQRSEDVEVSAYMHESTYLIVTPLEEDQSAVAQLLEQQLADGCLPYSFCDVRLINEQKQVVPYFGALEVGFDVGSQYDGQTLRVFHYVNGAVEVLSGVVANGRLTVTVQSLSPFMVEVPDANAHRITVLSGTGGSVLPTGQNGSVTVADGGEKLFTFWPDAGHYVAEVLVNGTPVAFSGNRYLLQDVRADSTLEVRFAVLGQSTDEHTLLVTSGPHGFVTPGTVLVPHGEDATIFFYPDPGYEVDRVLVDGLSYKKVEYTTFGICFTISAVDADVTVDVTFRKSAVPLPTVYNTVTAESGPGGSISPQQTVQVPYGGALYYYFIPDAGYVLDKVWVDGVETSVTDNALHLVNIVQPHTIRVQFRPDSSPTTPTVYHTVTTPDGTVQVPHGGRQFFYFVAPQGKEVSAVYVNGQKQPMQDGSFQLQDITEDTALSVTWQEEGTALEQSACHCLWAKLAGECALCDAIGHCAAPWCSLAPAALLLAAAAVCCLLWQKRRTRK